MGGSSCGSAARAAYAITARVRAEARLQRGALLPDNLGQPWTADEETPLVEAPIAGQPPEEIARQHRHTLRAVEARIQRMGRTTAEERPTPGGVAAAA